MDPDAIYEQRPWLGRYADYVPPDLGLPAPSALAMFREAATARPEAAALHYFDQTLTLAQVDRSSDALAAALAARGVGRGDRVAVYLQNVPQFPVATLAVWKAGGIMVPLNPMFKAQEVTYHLTDSGASYLVALESLYHAVVSNALGGTEVKGVITTSELEHLGQGHLPGVLGDAHRDRPRDTEDLAELVAAYDGQSVPEPDLGPDDVALLTYTSGTTGRPKGAMNTHRNLVFNSEVYRTWMQLGDGDVILGAAPLFHITGLVAHLTVSFLTGCPLVLFYRFEPALAARMVERWRATFTVATITAFQAMMNVPETSSCDLSSMRKVYSGGAPIAPAVVDKFEAMTGAYIHNIYGLTETNSPSHAVPMGARAPVDKSSGALSVGVPVPSTTVKVVDPATGAAVPPGEAGELWTKGPEVVPGYWQRPDATQETFTDGYLHTGDIGVMDADGWFYIIDRAKDMINAAGYKVWPREVEDYLNAHPAVREAAVIGIPDEYRGETVKAFVSLLEGQQATPEELIAFCRETMANYKVPRQVEILDEIPKTTSGKLLRRELRSRELTS